MTLPNGIEKVRVYGTYIDAEGNPLKGQILFTPSVNTAGSGVILLSKTTRVVLDKTGSFSVYLPTSQNMGLDPDGWTYQVDELILGHPRKYNILLAGTDGTSVPLATLAPVENVMPTGVYALLGHVHDDRYYTKDQVDALIVSGVAGVTSVNGRAGVVTLAKVDVGLSNVDNTSDANKPISTATAAALAGKSDTTHNHDTRYYTQAQVYNKTEVDALLGGVGGGSVASVFGRTGVVTAQTGDYTKAQVGLGNVDNTSDASKPISTATQTALDLKAPLASPTFTGTVAGITKAMVGLGNVDNTSDASKPVSTAQQTALNLKADLANKFEVPFAFTGTAVVTTGVLRWYNRTGRTLTIAGAYVASATAPTGADMRADVNKNGTTIYTTQGNRPTCTAGTNGGGISAAPDVTSLADGDYLTVDIDVIGSTVAGANVTVGVVMSG